MRALSICQPSPDDAAFFNWLAGFIDGEGCFYIAKTTAGSHRPHFRIKVRADDRPILDEICSRTGIGKVKTIRVKGGNPHAEWIVGSKSHCQRLVEILKAHPLRAKKAWDFEIWTSAVIVWLKVGHIMRGKGNGKGQRRHPLQSTLANIKFLMESERGYR